jgi:hypothetical protein
MRKKKRTLSIRITYEPNRLAKNYLAAAYEALVPTVTGSLKPTAIDSSQTVDDLPLKQLGGKPR